MYPVLNKVLGPYFALRDWLDRFMPQVGCTLLQGVLGEATPWFMSTMLILGCLLVILCVIDRVVKVVTGIRHLEATISKYRALNAELEETHAEQARTLMELTISLGSIEGQLLQNDIKLERLKQANADNSVKLRAAQDELYAAEMQEQTLRTDLKNIQDLYALASACVTETGDKLVSEAAQAADVERSLLHELADHDAQLDALDTDHATLLAAEDSLTRELAEYTQAHRQAAATLASEALAAQATLTALQDEISAEAAAHEAAVIERQKDLARLVFQVVALTARELLAEQEHAATLAAAQAEEASLEAQLASVNEELVAARTDRASLVGERDRLLHETSAVKANIDQAIEDGAIAEAALLIAVADVHAVDHEHTAALEKDVTDLTDTLMQTTAAYNDVQERFDLSTIEPGLHLETCSKQRAEGAE
ncbi:hypothetical protein PsYK624_141990 [Phanerochaete sordida]|uniref:Uncharacterized protein n=1 Tax=Phanerochaete sordida TaxID=48140 RepID=A0A9P3LL66_9APHY|nr:hypothetical protein PsYK624_141990 [Phanerochaete sordida]